MHLCCFGGNFCKYYKSENVPNDEFIRNWLRHYYEESNRLDKIQISNDEFDLFIENELKKVLINMLFIRLLLLLRAMFFFCKLPELISIRSTIDYAVAIYDDFLKNKDKDLKLLETLKK